MYPIQCPGGFAIPTIGGKQEIWGFTAAVSDTTLASELAIVDDPNVDGLKQGVFLGTLDNQPYVLAHVKGVASADGTLSCIFAEPIKTRYGVSAYFTNLKAGSVCVYRR